jgi:hypothetical protein
VFLPSRSQRGPDPWLPYRTLLFVAGAACGLAGMAFSVGWLVTIGIVLLVLGVVTGLIARRIQEARDPE